MNPHQQENEHIARHCKFAFALVLVISLHSRDQLLSLAQGSGYWLSSVWTILKNVNFFGCKLQNLKEFYFIRQWFLWLSDTLVDISIIIKSLPKNPIITLQLQIESIRENPISISHISTHSSIAFLYCLLHHTLRTQI